MLAATMAGTITMTAAATGLAVALLVGDWHLDQAELDFTLPQARAADVWLAPFPDPATQLAKVYILRSKALGADVATEDARARHWRLVAAHRDPAQSGLWNALADLELADGQADSAARHYRIALTKNPWSVAALNGMARAEIARGDKAAALPYLQRSLLVLPNQPNTAKLLDDS